MEHTFTRRLRFGPLNIVAVTVGLPSGQDPGLSDEVLEF